MAVSSERNEPTTRPRTPKNAPEETALFVPVRGPKSPIGMRKRMPTATPSSTAATACQNESPSAIGSVPSSTVAKVFAPPNWMRMRSTQVEVRSASGMVSMPRCSTSVARGRR